MQKRLIPATLALLAVFGLLSIVAARGVFAGDRRAPAATAPGTPAPESPVGLQLTWVLGTVENGATELSTGEISVRFAPGYLEEVSVERTLADTRQVAAAYGPLEVVRFARPASDTQAVVFLRSSTGDELLMIVAVEPDAPHRITKLTFLAAPSGELILAGGSGDFIRIDQPGLVVDAIIEFLEEIGD